MYNLYCRVYLIRKLLQSSSFIVFLLLFLHQGLPTTIQQCTREPDPFVFLLHYYQTLWDRTTRYLYLSFSEQFPACTNTRRPTVLPNGRFKTILPTRETPFYRSRWLARLSRSEAVPQLNDSEKDTLLLYTATTSKQTGCIIENFLGDKLLKSDRTVVRASRLIQSVGMQQSQAISSECILTGCVQSSEFPKSSPNHCLHAAHYRLNFVLNRHTYT